MPKPSNNQSWVHIDFVSANYRVVFDIEGNEIVVLRVGHRRDITDDRGSINLCRHQDGGVDDKPHRPIRAATTSAAMSASVRVRAWVGRQQSVKCFQASVGPWFVCDHHDFNPLPRLERQIGQHDSVRVFNHHVFFIGTYGLSLKATLLSVETPRSVSY